MAPPRRTVPVPVFRWFALASFLSMILIVLSGAAVRLTGSGLGCPDWPTCFKGRITSPWGIHHFIEYGNRMITVLLFMVVVGAVLYHRSKYIYGPGARCDVRDPHFQRIARLLWIPFVILVITGTATTGSGPHSGASQGQLVAKRLPFAFSNAS